VRDRPPAGTERSAVACSLGGAEHQERVQAWRALAGRAARREPLIGGHRLVFSPELPLEELTLLAAAEVRCCPFFAFTLTLDRHGIALEVTAPPEAAHIVDLLFAG
jgi:hypothetical protein